MIQKLEISGQHTVVTEDIQKYATKKIGKLDRYVGRKARQSFHAEVKLKQGRARDKRQFTCEVIVYVPGEVLTAKETTVTMFSSIDIVEEQLKTQLRRYKEKHADTGLHRRILARLARS